MQNIYKCFVVFFFSICMASCGSSESNGLGETVSVTASIKDATSISTFFAVGTPGNFGFGSLSYSFRSTALPYLVSANPSPIMITTARISYVPMPDSANNLSPVLPSFIKAIGTRVDAGGTGGVDEMGVTSSTVVQYLYDNFVAPPLGTLNVPGMQFNYVVVAEFSGYEINSGKAITCDQVVGNMFVSK